MKLQAKKRQMNSPALYFMDEKENLIVSFNNKTELNRFLSFKIQSTSSKL